MAAVQIQMIPQPELRCLSLRAELESVSRVWPAESGGGEMGKIFHY